MATQTSDDAAGHRRLAIALFNRTWELLDKNDRSSAEDAEMLTAAFTSRFHWRQVGEPENFAVSDWQVARVAAVLQHARLAEVFGVSSLTVAKDAALGPFYVGYAHEAIARAARLAGDDVSADEHLAAATVMLTEIEDDGERDLLAPDLEDLKRG